MAEQVNRLLRNQEADLSYLSPIDRLMVEREVTQAQPVSPTQRARNRLQTGEEVLGTLPVIGNAMSARDAYAASGEAYNALMSGNYKQAAGNALLAGISGVGAVTGLPTSRLAGRVARDAPDMASAFPAWHGSPHDFDEFKLDKIGSGEGNQAYGYGLYFAEHPSVAAHYRESLSRPTINGTPAADMMQGTYAKAKIGGYLGDMMQKKQATIDELTANGADPERIAVFVDDLKRMQDIDAADVAKTGRVYQAEIDAEPYDLLDWDSSLQNQPESIKAALLKIGINPDEINTGQYPNFDKGPMTGRLAYELLHDKLGYKQEAASEALLKAGIPGIRYKDQFSRGEGMGTSNYVIFDDKLVKIKGKE